MPRKRSSTPYWLWTRERKFLDAGIGSGVVASYMAERGTQIWGIHLTLMHVQDARRNVKARGLQDKVSIQQSDYHNLNSASVGRGMEEIVPLGDHE